MMLRRLHTYMAIFSAPIILFFCFTGALQLFELQTPRDGYRPPVLVQELATLHKKQRFALSPPRRPAPPDKAGANRSGPPPATLRMQLLRWVFLVATLALMASTVMGMWIGLTHVKRRRLGWAMLGLGTALPVLMVAL